MPGKKKKSKQANAPHVYHSKIQGSFNKFCCSAKDKSQNDETIDCQTRIIIIIKRLEGRKIDRIIMKGIKGRKINRIIIKGIKGRKINIIHTTSFMYLFAFCEFLVNSLLSPLRLILISFCQFL